MYKIVVSSKNRIYDKDGEVCDKGAQGPGQLKKFVVELTDMDIFVLITSYKEEVTIGKAVEQVIKPNKDLWDHLWLYVTSPDEPTLKKAEEVCQKVGYKNFRLISDPGEGKAVAMNTAVSAISKEHAINNGEDILIMTDGDMYISDNAIKSLVQALSIQKSDGVGGHPVSEDNRNSMFGFYSHLFCEAAHFKRLKDKNVPMSGYLYAVTDWQGIFPIPNQLRAEDAYISHKLQESGRSISYCPEALAYVKFPKNMSDWFKQKTRSLGGNVQVSTSTRSAGQDLGMLLFPITFAKTPREVLWAMCLYPLRLVLWIRIYFNHVFNRYGTGMWERIESSK